jgi:phytol kinase
MISPWLGIASVLVVLGALFGALKLLERFAHPHPEVVRKLLHVGMGLTALSFPWLFHEAWPVITLGALAAGGLLALRLVSAVRSSVGSVLHGVGRDSFGEFYFAIGISLLFVLAHGDKLLYVIPLLILTLADAVAALVGTRYGTLRYATLDGAKSAEGSMAFFLTTFACVHVSLLLFSSTGRLESLLIAVILGILVMLLEAIAWFGIDNLTIPVVGFVLLKSFLGLTPEQLSGRLAVIVILAAIAFYQRRRSTLDDDALLAAVLFSYVFWVLGGWAWLVAPATLFIKDKLQTPAPSKTQPAQANDIRRHNVLAVFSVCLPGLAWVVAAAALSRPALFFPFTLTFAAHLAIFETTRLRHERPSLSASAALAIATITGWLLIFIPYILIERLTPTSLVQSAIALPCVALVALLFSALQPGMADCPTDTARWLRQTSGAALASALGAVALALGVGMAALGV